MKSTYKIIHTHTHTHTHTHKQAKMHTNICIHIQIYLHTKMYFIVYKYVKWGVQSSQSHWIFFPWYHTGLMVAQKSNRTETYFCACISISQQCLCLVLHRCMYLCIYPLRGTQHDLQLGSEHLGGWYSPRASHLLLCCDRKWRQRAQSAALKTLYPLVIYKRPPSRAHNATPSFQREAICEFQLWGVGCFITKTNFTTRRLHV